MKLIFTVAIALTFIFQGFGQDSPNMKANHLNVHKIVIKEVLQTTSYTYLLAAETNKVQWMAVPKMEANVGETYYYQGGMEMGEFKSKELDRVFSSILFMNGVVDPEIIEGGNATEKPSTDKNETVVEVTELLITPAEGGITIEELFSNKEKYANKIVKITGKVTKYNSGIMGKNWIHLQDGTGKSEGFDFTATTQDEVKVKDIITIEGIITLDKDFGAGYFYEVIMESGKVLKK